MTPKRLLLLTILLSLAAFGLKQLADRHGDPSLPQGPSLAGEGALLPGDPLDLETVLLEQPRYGNLVYLSQDDRVWHMTEPLPDAAEPHAVRGLLQVLYGDDWERAPEAWQSQSDLELGLEPAALLVETHHRDGSSHLLRIGAEEENGLWMAAERDGERIRFPKHRFPQLAMPPSRWRDHRMQAFGVEVDSIVWQPVEGEPLEVEKRANSWHLMRPITAPLDELAVDSLMGMLGHRVERVGEFTSDQVEPGARIGTLLLRQGDRELVLEIHQRVILSSGRDYPLPYSERAFHFTRLSLEELRSRRVLDLNPDHLASVAVEFQQERRVFRRREGGWVEQGKDRKDPEVSAFVQALVEHGVGLERGEEVALPAGPPAGRVIYSISRTPQAQGSTVLQWWVVGTEIVVAPDPAHTASISPVNFQQGMKSLWETPTE